MRPARLLLLLALLSTALAQDRQAAALTEQTALGDDDGANAPPPPLPPNTLTAAFRGSPPWRAVPDLWVARTATVACEGGQVNEKKRGRERARRVLPVFYCSTTLFHPSHPHPIRSLSSSPPLPHPSSPPPWRLVKGCATAAGVITSALVTQLTAPPVAFELALPHTPRRDGLLV